MDGMTKRMKEPDIEEQLRQAILNCGMSRYELSRRCGVAASQLCFFVNGQRSLTMSTAAKVAKVLGLRLTDAKGGK
jgi:plasmid maintenance system antidote protein VapI